MYCGHIYIFYVCLSIRFSFFASLSSLCPGGNNPGPVLFCFCFLTVKIVVVSRDVGRQHGRGVESVHMCRSALLLRGGRLIV